MLGVILLSLLAGAVLTLLIQAFLLKKWFGSLPSQETPTKPQYNKYTLPKDLLDVIQDAETKGKKESCVCVNLIFQFLFRELKDTKHVRQWVMKRMNAEFAEMLQTTTGKLLDQITVRDFNLGPTFPVIKHATIQNVNHKDDSHAIEELTLLLDLEYNGGFQLAVDVDLVFGKAAYLSVKVTNIKGVARLQFSRHPFTHWSFTFVEDPTMEFSVESQFEGKPVAQISSLITNAIRRSVRKKHTMPNYKIRYRPFFIKPQRKPPAQDIYYHGNKLSTGQMVVTVLECSRLVKVSPDSWIYCTLAIDSMPWQELMSTRKKLWVVHDIEIIRNQATNIGLTFKEEFIHEKYDEMVVVETVSPSSPASLADIRKNDVVVAVGGTKVTSIKHAAKLMKQSVDRFTVRIERSTPLKGLGPQEFKFEEDTVSLRDKDKDKEKHFPHIASSPASLYIKDTDQSDTLVADDDDTEDFVNISITPLDPNEKTPLKDKVMSPQHEERSQSQSSSPRKGFSILSSSSGLFNRKRSKTEGYRTPRDSPEMKPKNCDNTQKKEDEEQPAGKANLVPPGGVAKKRSKSDAGSFTKERQAALDKFETSSTGDTSGSQQADDSDEESIDLRKTRFAKACQDPVFEEKFEFEVEDCHNYLNVCVWCKIPEKLDKQNRVIKHEKDVLIGHVSIALMDVALECIATLQSDTQQTYKLTPAEIKANASRTKISNLSSHPGFDERLCYGDITIGFKHKTQPLDKQERQKIEKMSQENENNQEKQTVQNQGHITNRRPVEEGKHDFIGTHFQSATYCKFCQKKIWLKVAFQCRICEMICHKKCTEKCQAQTTCTKEGFQWKTQPPPPLQEPSPTPSRKSAGKDDQKENNGKSSLFGRFRKDSPKLPFKDSNKLGVGRSGRISPLPEPPKSPDMRRHSAPFENENGELQTSGGTLLSVGGMPRTRSSTSLQDLIQENASPTLSTGDYRRPVTDDEQSAISSDSDDEMNLLKFFEQQKFSQNADEVVVTAAKEMGKELFAHLGPEERQIKLDTTVSKLQVEIDLESEQRAELARMDREATDPKQRNIIRSKIDKSDEKIQSLALLMLHYCAGLQHCLDMQEEEKQKREEEERRAAKESKRKESETQNTDDVTMETNNTCVEMAADNKSRDVQSFETLEITETVRGGRRKSSIREEEILRDEISGLTIKLTRDESVTDDEDDEEEESEEELTGLEEGKDGTSEEESLDEFAKDKGQGGKVVQMPSTPCL